MSTILDPVLVTEEKTSTVEPQAHIWSFTYDVATRKPILASDRALCGATTSHHEGCPGQFDDDMQNPFCTTCGMEVCETCRYLYSALPDSML